MNAKFIKIVSWHVIKRETGIGPKTLCGRYVQGDAQRAEALPAGKSCEVCLALFARQADST